MFEKLSRITQSDWFWLLIFQFLLIMLAVALLYQYDFDELPCTLCVQARAWVVAAMFASLIGFIWRRTAAGRVLGGLLLSISSIALMDRSYLLLATERGTIFGDCSMESGFPSWFPLDHWMPFLFEPLTTCGYTPELFLGITMGEALAIISAILASLGALVLIVEQVRLKS